MRKIAFAIVLSTMLLFFAGSAETYAATNKTSGAAVARPPAVTGFKATSSYNTIDLKWNKVPGVDGYIIRYARNGKKGATWIMNPNRTSYSYKVGKDIRYYFSIVSIKNNRISATDAKANSEAVRTLYYKITFGTTRTLTSHTGGAVKATFKAGTQKVANGFNSGRYIFSYNGREYWVSRISIVNPQVANLGNKKTYRADEAESFVNKRGLSSRTNYLVWTNTHTQKAYILKGKKGKWKVIKGPYSVSTGTPEKPTPTGLTAIQQKDYANYDSVYWSCCTAGFSIHSKPRSQYKPLGYPYSGACVRSPYEIAQWIYKNCPIGTAVYVF